MDGDGQAVRADRGGNRDPKRSVFAALTANTAIALTKFLAGAASGSASMLAEAVHSVADTGNQGLLLVGMHKAKRPPDATHPLGYGQERFFWSFLVAVSLFVIGAAFSIYRGVSELIQGHSAPEPVVPLIVLGLAACFEGYSWRTAWRQFNAARGDRSTIQALRHSKDPEILTVLTEDTAALGGIAVAAAGIWLAHVTGSGTFDSAGSIGIGMILAVFAFLLARESRHLLIGEAADPEVRRVILGVCEEHREVERVTSLITLQTAPEEVLVALDVEFTDGLPTDEIERVVDQIEEGIRAQISEARRIFIEPEDAPARDPEPVPSA
jgi:cation diffusion facilitator family transporter